jgi:DNA-directed RNA polymerase subunit RPC12/RpoP
MFRCTQCGGRLRRVHRTLGEHFRYLAIYECRECETETFVPRRYRHHLGPHCRCPLCGTQRLSRLRRPDRIDRMHDGFLNWLERLAGGGRLPNCGFCRLQFYDRQPLASEVLGRAKQALGPAPK